MYGLYTIGGEDVEKTLDWVSTGPRIKAYINKVAHSFLIDTWSPVNAIDEATYMALSDKPELKPCNQKYFGYTADKPIDMVGQFGTEIVVDENKITIPFMLVSGMHGCLLRYQTAQLLGIIKLYVNQINAKPKTKPILKS